MQQKQIAAHEENLVIANKINDEDAKFLPSIEKLGSDLVDTTTVQPNLQHQEQRGDGTQQELIAALEQKLVNANKNNDDDAKLSSSVLKLETASADTTIDRSTLRHQELRRKENEYEQTVATNQAFFQSDLIMESFHGSRISDGELGEDDPDNSSSTPRRGFRRWWG